MGKVGKRKSKGTRIQLWNKEGLGNIMDSMVTIVTTTSSIWKLPRDLQCLHHKKKKNCNYIQWWMLTTRIVIIISQCIQISNRICITETTIMLLANYTSIKTQSKAKRYKIWQYLRLRSLCYKKRKWSLKVSIKYHQPVGSLALRGLGIWRREL